MYHVFPCSINIDKKKRRIFKNSLPRINSKRDFKRVVKAVLHILIRYLLGKQRWLNFCFRNKFLSLFWLWRYEIDSLSFLGQTWTKNERLLCPLNNWDEKERLFWVALERSELLSLPKNSGKFQTQLYKSMDQWRIAERTWNFHTIRSYQISFFLFIKHLISYKARGNTQKIT